MYSGQLVLDGLFVQKLPKVQNCPQVSDFVQLLCNAPTQEHWAVTTRRRLCEGERMQNTKNQNQNQNQNQKRVMSYPKPTAPPLAFRAPAPTNTCEDAASGSLYSASIPDTCVPPPGAITFERDDRPVRPVASVPRHSPLPGARGGQAGGGLLPAGKSMSALPATVRSESTKRSKSEDMSRAHKPPSRQSSRGKDLDISMDARIHVEQIKEAAYSQQQPPSPAFSDDSDSSSVSTDKFDESAPGLSFFYGVFMGLLPPLLILHPLLSRFNVSPVISQWDRRCFVYGRSLGLLILVAAIIVIVMLIKYRI